MLGEGERAGLDPRERVAREQARRRRSQQPQVVLRRVDAALAPLLGRERRRRPQAVLLVEARDEAGSALDLRVRERPPRE
jgi:hypothetical protein